MNRGKTSKTLNKVKPVNNINKDPKKSLSDAQIWSPYYQAL